LFALIDKKRRYSLQEDDDPILYYDGLDKGVRDIQQDINVLLEE
jgi:hypothetical protein